MKIRLATVLVTSALFAAAQTEATKPLQRQVAGQALISKSKPAAELTFDKAYKYVGGQRWDLYGIADAEQHFFVKPGKDNTIESLYWVQFEEFLPSSNESYRYSPTRVTDIGGLEFIYDTRAYSDYSALNRRADSDGAYGQRLLEKHGYKFPKAAVRIRMVHLPAPDKRSELMIIYVESRDTKELLKGAEDGVLLDEHAPKAAKKILQNAVSGMQVRMAQ
jgi:hypothetical protein